VDVAHALPGAYGAWVLTLGVDLAAADVRTAIAAVRWTDGQATVESANLGVSDGQLIEAILRADKAGLDCPLGWPAKFVSFVVAQQSGQLPPTAHTDSSSWRRQLAYRVTDEVVRAETGLVPLSVSADRIAHAAFRCASLLARLAAEGRPVDRCGAGFSGGGLSFRLAVVPDEARRLSGLDETECAIPGHPPLQRSGDDRHPAKRSEVSPLPERGPATGR
jgi:hypothetical protein